MLKTGIRKYDIFKTYYWHGATLVGQYCLPQLQPNTFKPFRVISFNERSGVSAPQDHWIDFFIDDALFECFWNNAERYTPILSRFAGVISTDYSMYPDILPGDRIRNCTRNRVSAYMLQQNGINVIPTASWCNDNDFSWCFDGLPRNSSIAVTSNGCLSTPYGRTTFLAGVRELQLRLSPSLLVVCGPHMDELDEYANVFYYKSYSQRWKERAS